jgi:hypothetical protein
MNAMPKRKVLTLTDEAADLLPKLARYHDQGTYVSQLITAAAQHTSLEDVEDVEKADIVTLRRLVRDLLRDMADVKMVVGKIPALEQELERLKEE